MTDTARRRRNYVFYDTATSVCSECLRRVEAKIVFRGDEVWMDKWCPRHGAERVLISEDVAYWRMSREQYLKPSEMPFEFQTPMRYGCPYDCGLCPDHQQHACLAIVELTDHCNLRCPICFAGSGPERTRTRSLDDVIATLDGIVAAERTPDVVQLSGGEPTLHPDFFAILDAACARPIRHLMVNTNGTRIANDPEFVAKLAEYMPGFEVYLQFDSLHDDALMTLRGARLSGTRQKALEALEKHGISTTLVVTVARGVNDDQLGEIIEHALTWKCVRGVTLQPVQEAGRTEGYDPAEHRLTLTGVRQRVLAQSDRFTPDDIVPVPCHPDGLAMAYAVKHEGEVAALTGLFDRDTIVAGGPNTILFEKFPEVRDQIASCFSTGIGPEGASERLGNLLCCLPEVDAPDLSYENVFRLLIVYFQDARDFDLRAVKKSCIHFAQPSGALIPFETFNLFYRDGARERLESIRSELEVSRE